MNRNVLDLATRDWFAQAIQRTGFCTAEHSRECDMVLAPDKSPLSRARSLLDASANNTIDHSIGAPVRLAGIVLTRPGPVAWAIPGINPPIDRTAALDTVWVVIGPDSCTVITTEVEADRVREELLPAGVDLISVPWWDADAMVAAATELLDADSTQIGSDGHPAFAHDIDHELTQLRLALNADELVRIRELGRSAALAVEDALRKWQPGETDTAIAGRIANAVERFGGDAPVLLVGADDRLNRYRHPVAVGAPTHRCVMAVLVARHQGLHVALTRYTALGDTSELEARLDVPRGIHREVLRAGVPGATYGTVLETLADSYAANGQAGAWSEHYQGGPIGYAQREFEISPAQTSSPWWAQEIVENTAVAWNPSLGGGLKDEDTYVITADGVDFVTDSALWPMDTDAVLPRPLVLKRDGV
jgi:Xaa-Pro dipeptidase